MVNLNIDIEVGSCVYKLWYDNKYVIVKGKTLAGSIFMIEKGYAVFIAAGGGRGHKGGQGQKEWDGTNSYYFRFYKYMQDYPGRNSQIEILLESDNGYLLLKAEEEALERSMKDTNCLNNNVHAYLPKNNKWIKPAWILNYQKFLKRI